ncbi:MAG: hypothetical protein QXZ17_00995 [Nitrososphaerota archaeon]
MSVAIDRWNSLMLNMNLVEMILEISERRFMGIYYLAGAIRISIYEFAKT